MIIFKKFGETFEIQDSHWKRLRERFNPKNAKLIVSRGMYQIRKKCPFCSTYNSCKGCPFEVFEKYGCFDFFERIFPNGIEFDATETPTIDWDEKHDKEARKQLNRIQKMMDKIEASQ